MTIHFAFSVNAASAEREQVIHALRTKGGEDAHALFPNQDVPALSKLFRVSAGEEVDERMLVDWLNRESAVEHAEVAPRRRLAKRG